jgi:hypothetical protein
MRFHENTARASIALHTLKNVMRLCYPGTKLKERRQDGFFELPNKARIWIGGLDDKERVEKILGLEYVSIFLNEASQIPYGSALVAFTRLAQSVPDLMQHAYADLNPTTKAHWSNLLFGEKRDPVSMQLLVDPENYARAFLNPPDNAANLSKQFLTSLANLPERQRKRYFEGVYVDELDGALWSYELIESTRCAADDILEEKRASVVVALDPSGASGRDDLGADEIGLVVAARGTDGVAIFWPTCPAVRRRPSGGVAPSLRFTSIARIASWQKAISAARWCALRSRRLIHAFPCGLSLQAVARPCARSRFQFAMHNARSIMQAGSRN